MENYYTFYSTIWQISSSLDDNRFLPKMSQISKIHRLSHQFIASIQTIQYAYFDRQRKNFGTENIFYEGRKEEFWFLPTYLRPDLRHIGERTISVGADQSV